MNDDLQRRAKRVFDKIADLHGPERSAALTRECGDDDELKAEVRSLLEFWSAPTLDWVDSRAPEAEPSRRVQKIGPYRVIREIGRGGMGVVYLAKREGDQFRRSVALKVLKRGMDSEEVLRRFELERQVLAALNHPGIARLYDAGETEEGTPYFVMEYVEGMDIATYCDTRRLHISERLDVFRKVCEAVHYAHQNLVVHRDLKPSNIIMTEEGQPKLLDFGIAKIINPHFNLVTGDPTAPEFRVMTPEYASPEQVRGDAITTASDVYSLGVLLYQIVSGHPPYRIRTRVREELVRVICETEPERPSTAVGTVEQFEVGEDGTGGTTTITPKSVGTARDSRPQHLKRVLTGDIDNMVMKAMRKEPQRRYTSALQFAEDIRRYFDGLPVIARPDTLAYRMSKFVKRNRMGVAAAAVILLSLVGGIVGVSVALAEAESQAEIARNAQQEAELARQAEAAQRMEAETARSEAVLARNAERIARALANDAVERAQSDREVIHQALDTSQTFAEACRKIAKLPGALEVRRVIADAIHGEIEALSAQSDPDVVVRIRLAEAHQLFGDLNDIRNPTYGNSETALRYYRTALELYRMLVDERPDDTQVLRKATVSHISVATHLRREGETAAAFEIIQEGLSLAERLQRRSPDDLDAKRTLATVLITVGDCHVKDGDAASAIPFFERSLNLRQLLVAAHQMDTLDERNQADRDMAVICGRLGAHLPKVGRADEARTYHEKNVALRQTLVSRASKEDQRRYRRDLATAIVLLADFEGQQGRPAAARAGFEWAIAETEKLVAEDPQDVRVQRDLRIYRDAAGWTCLDLEDWPAAVSHFEARMRMDDPHDPEVLSSLAFAYHKDGRTDLAITTTREALGLLEGRTDNVSAEIRTDLEESLREYEGH